MGRQLGKRATGMNMQKVLVRIERTLKAMAKTVQTLEQVTRRMARAAGAAAVVGIVAALAAGCATAPRLGCELTQGPTGPDGAMITAHWGGGLPCAADVAPAAKEQAPRSGTWAGRQIQAAADWSTEHPAWASVIVSAAGLAAWGSQTDWWGLAKHEDPKPETVNPADDKRLTVYAEAAGGGSVAQVIEIDPVTAGKTLPMAVDGKANGPGSTVSQTIKIVPPME